MCKKSKQFEFHEGPENQLISGNLVHEECECQNFSVDFCDRIEVNNELHINGTDSYRDFYSDLRRITHDLIDVNSQEMEEFYRVMSKFEYLFSLKVVSANVKPYKLNLSHIKKHSAKHIRYHLRIGKK